MHYKKDILKKLTNVLKYLQFYSKIANARTIKANKI